MLKKISKFINCTLLGLHNYTCNAAEGIKPTTKQLESGMDGFWDYSKMYCKDCGHVFIKRIRHDKKS